MSWLDDTDVKQNNPLEDILQDNQNNENHGIRIAEALLFATDIPLSPSDIAQNLPDGLDARWILRKLQSLYDGRGVVLCENGGKWAFRSAPDLSPYLTRYVKQTKKLSRSAQEILGIIAYHQPITRTEIEGVRGVGVSKGTLDLLMDIGWIKLGKRRETPGRPVTFITTDAFLEHFGLHHIRDLPGIKELKEAGFLDHAGREITNQELKSFLDGDDNTEHDTHDQTELTLEQEDMFA
jgi:segregation and condensation protein B